MDLFKPNVEKLLKRGDISGLVHALGYPKDSKIRAEAAWALGELQAVQSVDSLIAALSDYHASRAAFTALIRIGKPRALDSLISAVGTIPMLPAKEVFRLLDWAGQSCAANSRIISSLENTLNRNTASDEDRLKAAEWLAGASTEEAVLALKRALWDTNPLHLSQVVFRLLLQLGHEDDKDQYLAKWWLRVGDWERCIAVGEEAIELLAAPLNAHNIQTPVGISYGAVDTELIPYIEALGRIGGNPLKSRAKARIVEALAPAWSDSKLEVRLAAIHAIEQVGEIHAALRLRKLSFVLDQPTAQAAAAALGRLDEAVFITGLNDEMAEARWQAARVLEEAPDGRAVQPLIKLLSDPSSDVRHHAIITLQRWERQQAVGKPELAVIHAVAARMADIQRQLEYEAS